MKKSIIAILIALMVMVPVFADELSGSDKPIRVVTESSDAATAMYGVAPDKTFDAFSTNDTDSKSTNTLVQVNLDLYPIYYSGITSVDVTADGSKIDRTNYTNDTFKNVSDVMMGVDKENYKLLDSTDNLYVSYFFYENTENVKVMVKINDNLKTSALKADEDAADAKDYIEYKAEITTGDNSTVTLHSNNKGEAEVVKKAATRLVGNQMAGSFKVVLKPETSDNGVLKNNIAGAYKSTITVSMQSYV